MNFCPEALSLLGSTSCTRPRILKSLEVRTALLVACKLLGETFPEFEAWYEDAKHDVEFRRQWYQERFLGLDAESTTNSTRMSLPTLTLRKNR